jgi:hypothetical protein
MYWECTAELFNPRSWQHSNTWNNFMGNKLMLFLNWLRRASNSSVVTNLIHLPYSCSLLVPSFAIRWLRLIKLISSMDLKWSQRWLWLVIIFCDVAPYTMIGFFRRFGGRYCLLLQGRKVSQESNEQECSPSALEMEKVHFSEMSVNFCQTARRHIPKKWYYF